MTQPDRPYTGVVEIRIHGVSGTPPESLLEAGPVRQAAGDRIGGFYRPTQPDRLRDNVRSDPSIKAPWLEAYSWGGWTSGARTRALWILLLPFALLNVAPRMLPPSKRYDGPPVDDDQRRGVEGRHRFLCGLVRLLSLAVTVSLVLAICQVSLITVGLRCATFPNVDTPTAGPGNPQGDACYGVPEAVTSFLAQRSPSWQLGLAALIPLVVLVLLWLLSSVTTQRYEDVQPEADLVTAVRPDDDRLPLGRRDLWRGSQRVRRLRLIHVHAGFATIVVALGGLFPFSSGGPALIVGLFTLAATSVLATYRPANESTRVLADSRWLWALLVLDVAAVAYMLVSAAADDTWRPDPAGFVATMNVWVIWLYGLQLAGLLVLFVVLASLVSSARRLVPVMHFNGFGAFVFAFLGCLTGALFNASLLILAPVWLFTDSFVLSQGQIATFLERHPTWFGASTLNAGYALVATLAILLAIAVVHLAVAIRALLAGTPAIDNRHVDQQYGADVSTEKVSDRFQRFRRGQSPYDDVEAHARTRRTKQIRRTFWVGRRVDYAPATLTALVIGLSAVELIQVAGYATNLFGGSMHVLLVDERDASTDIVDSRLLAWGAYLLVLAAVAIVALAIASYRTAGTRRAVGVLWDLTCFWPRDVHPFAPPCYTERIVPEVTTRMKSYLVGADAPASGVVLAAHSQGTVISMAVLLAQPTRFPLDRVGLLTCGTVLDRLYARFFPRYFSAEAFQRLNERLTANGPDPDSSPRWVNLWRYSDYLGGPVPFQSPRRETRGRAPLNALLDGCDTAIHAATAAARCSQTLVDAVRRLLDLVVEGKSGSDEYKAARRRSIATMQAADRAIATAKRAAAATTHWTGDATTTNRVAGDLLRLVLDERDVDPRRRLASSDRALGAAVDAVTQAEAAAREVGAARSHLGDVSGGGPLLAAVANRASGNTDITDLASRADSAIEAAAQAANQALAVASIGQQAASEALERVAELWGAQASDDVRTFARRGGSVPRIQPDGSALPMPVLPSWPENERLIDPVFDTPEDDIVPPPAGRHSFFWRDDSFQRHVALLADRLPSEPGSVP